MVFWTRIEAAHSPCLSGFLFVFKINENMNNYGMPIGIEDVKRWAEAESIKNSDRAINNQFKNLWVEEALKQKLDADLKNLCDDAIKSGSYFATITIKDKTKTENDLNHYAIRQNFATEDIIPSLDASVRSIGIKFLKPVDVIKLESIVEEKSPLKIAIISHFNRCPDSYAPGKACKNFIKILMEHGHKPVFFTLEGSKLDVGCEMIPLVTRFKREKNVINEEAKKKFIDVLREQLTSDFDLAVSFDLYIDDCITFREAIKECNVPIQWIHWARSGIGQPIDFKMDNARYIYMNYGDVGIFAEKIGVTSDKVRVVFNEKDGEFFFGWNPITKMIVNKFELWNRDIIQTYPICSTRLSAKGLDSVVKVFVELKRLGKKVCLIIANSNGRRRMNELKTKQQWVKELGLNEDEFVFTSMLANKEYGIESEVPNRVVAELMQISNLFVFPTQAEVSSNALLEASMTKQLIVLNADLPHLFDACDKNSVLSYPFTSMQNLHYTGRDNESLNKLAKQIVGQIESNKSDKQFRHVWRVNNKNTIYREMIEPILYEEIK